MLEIRQSIERDLVAKINSTLEPLLGAEKFRAGASVECDFTTGEQSEEIFRPGNRSVMVTYSQKSEDSSSTGGAAPEFRERRRTCPALRRTSSHSSLAGVSRRTESISYQSSRTVKHVTMPEGSIKKMSLAVLVDQAVPLGRPGEEHAPRSGAAVR